MKKRQQSEAQKANTLLRETGQLIPGIEGVLPSTRQLGDYLLLVDLEEERLLAGRHICQVFGEEWNGTRVSGIDAATIYLEGPPDASGKRWRGQVAIRDLLERWRGQDAGNRPPHPLAPIIRAYWAHPHESAYRRYRRGIMPTICAKKGNWDVSEISTLAVPDDVGPFQGTLPNLELSSNPDLDRPALLAVYDHFAEIEAQGNSQGRMSRTALAMRVFLEALMMLDRWHRNGRGERRRVEIREIVGTWLLWRESEYRPSRPDSGLALLRALASVDRLIVPLGKGGWYHPVRVNSVSGRTLDDYIEFEMILPPNGSEPAVGPPVDLRMSRMMGHKSPPSLRAYLALVCDWDRHAGKNGRLIRPMIPKVLRNGDRQIVDQDGRPVYDGNGRPEKSWSHPSAVMAGEEREPNPARKNYPEYDDAAIRRLALPRHLASDSRRQGQNTGRARRYVEHILEAGGVVIETLGHDGGTPWRIMPPDGFNQVPFLDTPEEVATQIRML